MEAPGAAGLSPAKVERYMMAAGGGGCWVEAAAAAARYGGSYVCVYIITAKPACGSIKNKLPRSMEACPTGPTIAVSLLCVFSTTTESNPYRSLNLCVHIVLKKKD